MNVTDYDVGVVKALDSLVLNLNRQCPYIKSDVGWRSLDRQWKCSDFKYNRDLGTIEFNHSSCGINTDNKYGSPNLLCEKCRRYIEKYQEHIRNMDRRYFSYQAIIDKINEIERRLSALEKRVGM